MTPQSLSIADLKAVIEPPYVPFYKPYGMSDEEYEYEVRIAEQRLAEWYDEQDQLHPPTEPKKEEK